MSAIPMVDVFAGPGGLNEGFSSLRDSVGDPVFETAASFELDPTACATLRLRAALRQAERQYGEYPEVYYRFLRGEIPYAALAADDAMQPLLKEAHEEVEEIRLGEDTRERSDEKIAERLASARSQDDPWVLVGGPPCQAYSLAGRSRRTGDPTFKEDHKHLLYREYLHIIEDFDPALFVMENVKGMLSSQHEGSRIFDRIKSDLEGPGQRYSIKSFRVSDNGKLQPHDYILRAEDYGVPQRRHRVILLGIRNDVNLPEPDLLKAQSAVTVADAIGSMPRIRSVLSKARDTDGGLWKRTAEEVFGGPAHLQRQPCFPPVGATSAGGLESRARSGSGSLTHDSMASRSTRVAATWRLICIDTPTWLSRRRGARRRDWAICRSGCVRSIAMRAWGTVRRSRIVSECSGGMPRAPRWCHTSPRTGTTTSIRIPPRCEASRCARRPDCRLSPTTTCSWGTGPSSTTRSAMRSRPYWRGSWGEWLRRCWAETWVLDSRGG